MSPTGSAARACPICDAAFHPGELTCRDCAYLGLDPLAFVRFFWEEA